MGGSNESPLYVAGSLRRTWRNAGTPINGTSGTYAGVAEPGDLLIDTTNMRLFINTNTQASPKWAQVIASAPITTKTGDSILTVAESGIIFINVDNVYATLPTYVGNAGLSFIIKGIAAYGSGVLVKATLDGGKVDGADTKRSQAQYNVLHVICGSAAWHVVGSTGIWV